HRENTPTRARGQAPRLLHLRLQPGERYRGLTDAGLNRPLLFELAADHRGPKGYDRKTLRRVFDGAAAVIFGPPDSSTFDWFQAMAGAAPRGEKRVLVTGPANSVDAGVACAGAYAPNAMGARAPGFETQVLR